ncbi:MAG: ABC transporter permease [Candidatus Dormibacteria bacterium]
MLAVAALTLREAVRRRLLIALAGLTAVAVIVTAFGFWRLTGIEVDHQPITPLLLRGITSQLLILLMFMFSFLLAVGTVLVAALSVAAEVESGVILAVAARPVTREQVLIGKWLGLSAMAIVYTVVTVALELFVIQLVTGYLPPDPVRATLFLCAEGLTLLTFATLLGTRLSPMVSGILAVASFGVSWMAGIIESLGTAFDNQTVVHTATAVHLLFPSDALWRGVVHNLTPAAEIAAVSRVGRAAASNPFFAATDPTSGFIAWWGFWVVLVLGLSLFSFRRREL